MTIELMVGSSTPTGDNFAGIILSALGVNFLQDLSNHSF